MKIKKSHFYRTNFNINLIIWILGPHNTIRTFRKFGNPLKIYSTETGGFSFLVYFNDFPNLQSSDDTFYENDFKL
jgi:hypothetical protein